jgi:hypothetical protein
MIEDEIGIDMYEGSSVFSNWNSRAVRRIKSNTVLKNKVEFNNEPTLDVTVTLLDVCAFHSMCTNVDVN